MKKDLNENKNYLYYIVLRNFIKDNPNKKLYAEGMFYDKRRTGIYNMLNLNHCTDLIYCGNNGVKVFSPCIYIYDTEWEKTELQYLPKKLPGEPGEWTDDYFSIIISTTIINGKIVFNFYNYATKDLELSIEPNYKIVYKSPDNKYFDIKLYKETSITIEEYNVWLYDIILDKIREFEQSKMVNK